MFKDIYLKDLATPTKSKRTYREAMAIELISNEEKKFIEQYSIRLLSEQNKVNKDEIIVYTRVTMQYAVQHKLCYIPLVFHPCSIARRQYFQNEDTSNLKELFQNIIVWETTQQKTYLSQAQLEVAIKHFRALEKR